MFLGNFIITMIEVNRDWITYGNTNEYYGQKFDILKEASLYLTGYY